jgi:hypothetical protein
MIVAVASLVVAACGFESKSTIVGPTAPSASVPSGSVPTSTTSYVGTWKSQTLPSLPSVSTCGNFQWVVTSQTATSLAGNFSALCAGNLTMTGSAAGQLGGQTIPMTATGTATTPGLPSCGFSLTGTGSVLDNNSIQINYSGTTCAGPVHGTETLYRAPV